MTYPFASLARCARPARALSRRGCALLGALLLVLVAHGLAAAPAARAQIAAAAVPFLRIEPDSRISAMGNAGVALANDPNAVFWNPAGLGFQTSPQVAFTHVNWLPELDAGLFYEYLAGAYHVEGVGTFGAHLSFFNLGESEIRTRQNDFVGDFNSYDFALGFSYARLIGETFSVGGSVRGIYSRLAPGGTLNVQDGSGSAVAFDLAALYRTRPLGVFGETDATLAAGFNLANMGTQIQYDEVREPLPMNIRLGYAVTLDFDEYNQLTFTNDFNKQLVSVSETCETVTDDSGQPVTDEAGNPELDCTDYEADPFYRALFNSWGTFEGEQIEGESSDLSLLEQFTVGLGVEYWYNQLFALRTGYFYEDPNNGDRQYVSFGAGLRYNVVGIDFSYIYAAENDPVANTLRFSVLFNFQN